MNAGEELIARIKRIAAMEMEMDALKREEEALRAEGDETGSKEQAADIERRKAELAKRMEEENKNIGELLADVKAEGVLDWQEERYWYIQACILFCRRLDLIENFLRFNFENGISLWNKFTQAYPNLCRVSESDCFTGFCGRGTMVDRIIEERICCKTEPFLKISPKIFRPVCPAGSSPPNINVRRKQRSGQKYDGNINWIKKPGEFAKTQSPGEGDLMKF